MILSVIIFSLLSLKVFLGIIVLGIASRITAADDKLSEMKAQDASLKLTREPTPPNIINRKPKTETVANLRNVERFELLGGRIV